MGWTSSSKWVTKGAVVKDIMNNNPNVLTIEYKVVGQAAYALHMDKKTGEKWIGIYALSKGGGEWAYKDMSEMEHPYYYDCPLMYLDSVPCPDSDNAREWRRIVKIKAKPLQVGSMVKLIDGCRYKGEPITEVKLIGMRPLLVQVADGTIVSMQKKMIAGPS